MKVNLLPDETKANSEFRCAREGDILLARVGKRCIGKVAIIESGRINISDCVYRIRPPEGMAEYLLDSFLSDKGQRWFEAHAHGVCAKVISKRDLLQFPVPSILSVAQKIQRQPDEKAAFARSSIFQE